MKNKIFFSSVFFILMGGLTSSLAQNSTNSSQQIKNLIAKKREFNKTYGYGYTIQIYYGDETKARSLENKFKVTYPNVYTHLNYSQPYWKVQVGNYKTKLEADRAMLNFSEKFSGLMVIPLGK